jgi:hypothetical protein
MTFDEGMALEEEKKDPGSCILHGVHHDSFAEVLFRQPCLNRQTPHSGNLPAFAHLHIASSERALGLKEGEKDERQTGYHEKLTASM